MKDVSVTEFRQNLQAFLAKVRRGERLRVTSRGKVIAELSPPSVQMEEGAAARRKLKGSILRYDDPTSPVFDDSEWEMNR